MLNKSIMENKSLIIYLIVLIIGNAFGKRVNFKWEDELSYSEGSARLLQRFEKIRQNFKDLKAELGYQGNRMPETPPIDPAAHLKNSKCAETGDCIYQFQQDNVTSSFKWYRNFILEENFPIRNPDNDPNKTVLVATVKNRNLKRNQHSILSTNVPIKKKHQCVDFYYYMFSDDGCDVIRFSVILKCAGHPDEVIIKTSGTRKKKWHYVLYEIQKPIGTKCQLHWKAAKGLSNDGKVGIDDVNIHYENCPTNGRVFLSRLSCLFNSGSCLWSPQGDLKWKQGTHDVFSMQSDHYTKRQGYNIHVNNSQTVLHPNKTSILTSPVAITSQARCFSMQLLTKGKNPGNLTISLITENETKVIWRDEEMKKKAMPSKAFKNGELLMWQTALVDLPTKTNFKIEIKFLSNINGSYFFVALSNIRVLDGECEIHVVPNSMYNSSKNKIKKQQRRSTRRSTRGSRKHRTTEDKNLDKPKVTLCTPFLDLVFFFLYIVSGSLQKV